MCTNKQLVASLLLLRRVFFVYLAGLVLSSAISWAGDGTIHLKESSVHVRPESGQISLWVQEEPFEKGTPVFAYLNSVDWNVSERVVPNLGYTLDVYWFRVRLRNESNASDWLLAIEYPLISSLDLYQVVSGSVVSLQQTGDRFEFKARPAEHRNFVFPLSIEPNESSEIYIRVESEYALQLPVSIARASNFWEKEAMESLVHGLFFGFLVLMVLYNLFIFFATRDVAYFYYVIFSLFVGLFQLSQQGFGYQYIWPTNIWLQHHVVPATCCLAFIFAALFVQSFLNTAKVLPKSHMLLNGFYWMGLILCILAVFVDEHIVQWSNAYMGGIVSLAMFFVGIRGWQEGIKEARFFVLAWFIFLVSILAFAGNKLGFLPRNFWTEYGVQIGTALELSLLSFALADRINSSRIKQQELLQETKTFEQIAKIANERALEVERLSKDRLEKNMKSRTEQLHSALQELSIANRQLEEMSTVDSLTGVRSLAFFKEKADEEWERCVREKHSLTLMLVSIDQFELIGDRYGYVAAEEILKNVSSIVRRGVTRPADSIGRIATAEFGVLMPNTELSGGQHVAQGIFSDVASEPLNLGVCSISVTISISVVSRLPGKGQQVEALFEDSQALLISAVESGGNRIVIDKVLKDPLV